MGPSSEKRENYAPEILVIAGYIIFFCLAFIAYIAYLVSFAGSLQKVPSSVNVFATSLPPTTPTPYISSADLTDAKIFFEDDFSDDQNGWTTDEEYFKEKVDKGKLFLESIGENNAAKTECKLCPSVGKPYYLQSDLTSEKATDESFGIVFNLDHVEDSYFLFQINTESKKYFLYNYANRYWSLMAAGQSDLIETFPKVNTLGVYVNYNFVELYINGQIVDSYKQSGHTFHTGEYSFFADNAGFRLIIDNLKIYTLGQ